MTFITTDSRDFRMVPTSYVETYFLTNCALYEPDLVLKKQSCIIGPTLILLYLPASFLTEIRFSQKYQHHLRVLSVTSLYLEPTDLRECAS